MPLFWTKLLDRLGKAIEIESLTLKFSVIKEKLDRLPMWLSEIHDKTEFPKQAI